MRRRLLILAGLLTLLAIDGSRPPARQWVARLELAAIDLYQATLSGRLPARCRFEPSCSRYGEQVIAAHGAPRGTWLALRRILRCGPWTPAGTVDPPPPAADRVP